jgi:hypothetical protein
MDPTFWRIDEGGLPGCPIGTIISLVPEGSSARVMRESGQVGTLDVSTTTQTSTPGGASITLVNETEGWRAVLSRTTGFAPMGAFGTPMVAAAAAQGVRPRSGMGTRTRVIVGVVVALVVLAAIGATVGGAKPTPTPLPALGGASSPGPTSVASSVAPSDLSQAPPSQPPEVASEEPSTAPAANGPSQQEVGDVVSITCDGVDCMTVSLDKVAFAKSYRDPQGFLNDTPDTKGDVFLAFHVTYRATGPSADYNEFDWGVYVNDTADDITTFVEHGPKPTLSAGDLPQGKSASGWVVEEVPATGRVVVAYQPGQNDIFEVVVRSK